MVPASEAAPAVVEAAAAGCRRVPQDVVTPELLGDFHAKRSGGPHPPAGRELAFEAGNRIDRRRRVLYLMFAVREPEQRFVSVRFLGVGNRGFQLVDRALPLLVGDEILRPGEPLRVGGRRRREPDRAVTTECR